MDFVAIDPSEGRCSAVNLACTLSFGELVERQIDRLRYTSIRLLLHSVLVGNPVLAKSDGHKQFTTRRLELLRYVRPLPENRQLHFTHRDLYCEQQSIIGQAWVVDGVFIDNQLTD
jgi:hypothetical protein